MAELKAHSTAPEAILSPDEGKLREEYDENRLESLSDLAISQVDKTTRDGGLEGFFEDFIKVENGKLSSVESPDKLVENTVNRVFGVLDSAGRGVNSAPTNGSGVSSIDKLLWNARRVNVLDQIKTCNSEGATSLSVLAGHEVFLEEAKKKVASEYDEQRQRVTEAYDGEGKFKKFCTNVAKSRWGSLGASALAGTVAGGLAVASGGISIPLTAASGAAIGYVGKKIGNGEFSFFGHRMNATRERKLEKLDSEFKQKLDAKYAEIKSVTDKIKGKEDSTITRVQTKIDRKFKATLDSKEKQHLWAQVRGAINHTGSLTSLNLGRFGVIDNQDKILFLEALKQSPNLLAGLENRKVSEEMHQLQENVVEGAQAQEKYMENPDHFSFESLQSDLNGRNIPASSAEVKSLDLIASLSNDIQGQGIDLESDVYGATAQEFRGLMTDSARLAMLGAYLKNNNLVLAGCSGATQSDLLKWIEDQDKATAGPDFEGYTANSEKAVKAQFDAVKLLVGDGVDLVERFKAFSKATIASKKLSDLNSDSFFREVALKKDDFDRIAPSFPGLDKKELEQSWENLLKLRKILLDTEEKWNAELAALKTWSTENNKIEKTKNKIIQKCENGLSVVGLTPYQMNSLRELQEKERERYEKHLEKKPEFTALSVADVDSVKFKLESFAALNFDDVFTKEKVIRVPSLNARIQRSLHAEFQKDLEVECLKNLHEHDQFERIKELPMGSTVEIDYREVSGVTHLRLPNQLEGSLNRRFRVVRSDANQVVLENDTHSLVLQGPCSDGVAAFKNARIRRKSGTPDAGNWAIAYNYKII